LLRDKLMDLLTGYPKPGVNVDGKDNTRLSDVNPRGAGGRACPIFGFKEEQ
jgi:hypothetical protein